MTKVAIITRTKDRPVFLRRALLSVGSQTFRDYVHVIVNDAGDTSKVDELVDDLDDEQKAKTKVFHRESPSNGPDTIFNESIDRVDSEYFVIHDDDDTWHSDFLKKTVECLDERAEIAAVVVRADRIEEVLDGDEVIYKRTTPYMQDLKVINLYRQCIDNQFTPIATLFRRSAYKNVGGFDNTLPVVGDWEFGIRLLLKYDGGYVDPGFALAHYHHRKAAPGTKKIDNSFAKYDHRYYFNLVANRYLRDELSRGELGVGYIINSLRYEQGFIARLLQRILPGFVVRRLKKKIQN